MKICTTILILSSAILSIAPANAASVDIQFENPSEFTDVSYDNFPKKRDRIFILQDVEKYMQQQLEEKLQDKYSIKVKITNIDLAGDFEPWHPDWKSDVRIIRRYYPARINLDYVISDANGDTIESDSKTLVGFNSMARIGLKHRKHPYLKLLIDRWIDSLNV